MSEYDIIFISGSHKIYGGGQVYLEELNKKLNEIGCKSVILSSDDVFQNSLTIPRVDTWRYKTKNYLKLISVVKEIDTNKTAKIVTNDITLSMVAVGLRLLGWNVYPLIHMSMYNTTSKSRIIRVVYPLIRSLFIRLSAKKILSVNKENDKILGQKAIYIGNFTINKSSDEHNPVLIKDIDLIYVGRFDREKQPERFVNLIEQLRLRGRNVRSYMIGDGEYFQKMNCYIKEKKLDSFINLLGFIPKEKIIQYYKRSKFVVITSKTEGLPTVILDGAVYGVNFIAPAIGSIPYLNEKWSVGHIVSVDEMVDYIDRNWHLLSSDYSTNSISKFSQEHSLEHFASNFLKEVLND